MDPVPKYDECTCENWDELRKRFDEFSPRWVFRGQCRDDWGLTTSLERSLKGSPLESRAREVEKFFLFQFKRQAHHYLTQAFMPDKVLDWLALMQHHGTPTRLLDFTRSPYVAAFFAVEDADDKCAVWAIDAKWCHTQACDEIFCHFDFPNYTEVEKELLNPASMAKIFENQLWELSKPFVLPVEPYKMNKRLTIQQGLFLCPGDVNRSFEDNLLSCSDTNVKGHVTKIIIEKDAREEGLDDLWMMNINRASLFPGIDGFARSLSHQLVTRDTNRLVQIIVEDEIRKIHDRMRRDKPR